MNNFDEFLNPHAYWDSERQEGPTDWGYFESSTPQEPTDEEWAELQDEINRERQPPTSSTSDPKLPNLKP